MLEKLIELKLKNKWAYYLALSLLLIPAILLAFYSFVSPAIRSWLKSSAEKLLKSSADTDSRIAREISELEKQDAKIQGKTESLDQALEKIKNSNDADWHKRQK